MSDLISRADVEQTVEDNILCYTHSDRPIDQDPDTECHMAIRTALKMLIKDLRKLPSAQPDRDIPIKPAEATETYLGRCVRTAVCPKCDYHLGRVYFLSDGHDIGVRKISYCETCGQAIDWSEWEDEDEQTD